MKLPKRYYEVSGYGYKFFVDVSGQPNNNDDIYIGCILLNEKFRSTFIERFYNKFPYLRAFKKKATNLSRDALKDVIEFIDSQKLSMACLKFHNYKMRKYKKQILEEVKKRTGYKSPTIKNFEQRILGILYYDLLRVYARKNYHYDVCCCMEPKIEKILEVIKQLAIRDNYYLHVYPNTRRIEHMLKFADFVAGAGRKVEEFILNNFKYYTFFRGEPKEYDINKIFRLNKINYEAIRRKKLNRLKIKKLTEFEQTDNNYEIR